VSENDDEIVWESMNECPTLDACNRLGLDTKAVCREVYEKSTQAFLSELDPQLRFWRSYDHIRPHAPSCREAIYRIDFESMMRLAIEEAEIARSAGNEACGAVLVLGQDVIATGHHEPSAHAAIQAIRMGNGALGDSNLCGGVLFTTCEPCSICTAEAVRANLTTMVYGSSRRDSTNTGESRRSSSGRALVERASIWLEIIGGVLEEECKSLSLWCMDKDDD
jgi:tRNA(adenine34) deaminase